MFNYNMSNSVGRTNCHQKKRRLVLEEIDDVSSEGSSSDSEDSEEMEQYLQECYYNAYLYYEQDARQSNHVVDIYTNYNPNSLWQSVYLHNQQIE